MANTQYNLGELNDSLKEVVVKSDTLLKEKLHSIGIMGRIFGDKEYSHTNIIGFCLIFVIVFSALVIPFFTDTKDFTRKDILTWISPILTTLLGFFIGSIVKK